ncbi:hypothetical protein N479_19325 [Pseudoalteromonas luteoviolacea S4054]|uniref:Bacteriocin n=1 Tax=Pseudoalteromonas luteoviolacea S4054 TaxID=1129367 RepID=A0A0F6A8H2_9GAMM|nr:hypothetical protein N479_19325 [Pseudoalteromonas luteoviolacea S4054]
MKNKNKTLKELTPQQAKSIVGGNGGGQEPPQFGDS